MVDELAEERIRELAALPPHAYAAAKRSLRGVTTIDPKAYEAELAEIMPAWTDERVKQLVSKQLSKPKA